MDPRFRRFFANLYLPALKTLFIDFIYVFKFMSWRSHWEGVVGLLLHSGATLQNLEMRAMITLSLPRFLETFTILNHLGITDNLFKENNELICRLIYDPYIFLHRSSHTFVPKLGIATDHMSR
ncbi:hypothetical protein BD410DRAFT_545894 [Rickenella mellea]|uniref:Uncharacterized protein n=1 Tax=Rickenella mellea TaxID=50990 RepID=A0A4Y7PQY0_9AGAM|nr:hypothetical protein BD410DRAFT_545894 [Rickenella mellea]